MTVQYLQLFIVTADRDGQETYCIAIQLVSWNNQLNTQYTMRKLKHITEICAEIYEKEGFTAVCEYANKILESESLMKSDIAYEYCKGCDTDTPAWRHNCLVCGQTTEPHYFKV